MKVNSHFADVYSDINAWDNYMNFSAFDFNPNKAVSVEVTCIENFENYEILPTSAGVKSERDGNVTRFTVDDPDAYYSIVFDNDYEGTTLHLFANLIDTDVPTQSSEDTIYYGPGYYDLTETHGGMFSVPSGKRLYIAGGAVLNGAVAVDDAKECCCGWPWTADDDQPYKPRKPISKHAVCNNFFRKCHCKWHYDKQSSKPWLDAVSSCYEWA